MAVATSSPSSPADAGTRSPQPYRLRWVVAAVVLAANVMDLLDATIVNVAGPSIHHDLGGGASTLQWLSAGYTLAFAVLLIAGARLGDIFGRRRLFLVGSAGFTLFSAASAAAPTHRRADRLSRAARRLRRAHDPPGLWVDEAGLRRRGRDAIRHWVCSVRQRACRCSPRRSSPAR